MKELALITALFLFSVFAIGQGNYSYIEHDKDRNIVTVDQIGKLNIAIMCQYGNWNIAHQYQKGYNNSDLLILVGNGNRLYDGVIFNNPNPGKVEIKVKYDPLNTQYQEIWRNIAWIKVYHGNHNMLSQFQTGWLNETGQFLMRSDWNRTNQYQHGYNNYSDISITLWSDYNKAFTYQVGRNNRSYITQFWCADHNNAATLQFGLAHKATIYQHYDDYNTAVINQGNYSRYYEGGFNIAYLEQTFGVYNKASIDQKSFFNQAALFQYGSFNTALQCQQGCFNTAKLFFDGNRNSLITHESQILFPNPNPGKINIHVEFDETNTQHQEEHYNYADIGVLYISTGNRVSQFQEGCYNIADLYIYGKDYNRTSQYQHGFDNVSFFDIYGYGGKLISFQVNDYNKAYIRQYGCNDNAAIGQFGKDHSGCIIQVSGSANTAVINQFDSGWQL